jgi:hypothetical protein
VWLIPETLAKKSMTVQPPPLSKLPAKRTRPWLIVTVICCVVLIVVAGGYLAICRVIDSGITKGPDAMFGDQHLKTAVALIELHKVRFGSYPGNLQELKFTGQWDLLALQSVSYRTNDGHTAYFVEVQRGWIGKPDLEMPEGFWNGTGYSVSLKPKKQ